VCELGCGPALPSLTAAKMGAKVIATDYDLFALEMVRAAAEEQGFVAGDGEDQRFITRQFDLTSKENELPSADLYIMSDVFESSAVAEGAAWHVQSLLSKSDNDDSVTKTTKNSDDATKPMSRVWVFAQSDRSQRDFFLAKMRECHNFNNKTLGWTSNHTPDRDARLWLFDLDETVVQYN
jgi:methylase of polypeptide subunit release factors